MSIVANRIAKFAKRLNKQRDHAVDDAEAID